MTVAIAVLSTMPTSTATLTVLAALEPALPPLLSCCGSESLGDELQLLRDLGLDPRSSLLDCNFALPTLVSTVWSAEL